MKRVTKRILIVCGSGVATSTIARKKVEDILKERNIHNVILKQCSIAEFKRNIGDADLVITTTVIKTDFDEKIVNGLNLINGKDIEKTIEEIIQKLSI
ncbi:PTS sugar transporter subunit IIB [Clostridium sp. DL1XJH146]